LNKEWLSDYVAHEQEEFNKFINDFYKTGKIDYPPKSRFRKLKYPIVDTTSNIWSIIPFYGSSIIHVFPSNRESTIRSVGWGSDTDINNLIQLAKDTGRVQFVLDSNPLKYEHHDYLEPILKELHPPVLEFVPELVYQEDQIKKTQAEFTTMWGYKFVPLLKQVYDHYYKLASLPPSFEDFLDRYQLNYTTIRLSGYDEIADKILNSLVDDPNLALYYLQLYGVLLATPKTSSLHLSYNPILSIEAENLKYITTAISNLTQESMTKNVTNLDSRMSIVDVGRLLLNKLTLGADGYLGCQALIDMYKDQDLQKLLKSVQDGIERKKIDIIESSSSELSTTLDNIWNNAKVSKLSTGISYGVPLLLGTIGPIASQGIGGAAGILAGLGFRALDKIITPRLTKEVAKLVNSDYLVAIYEFKKKYNIKN
jgi:hypothetical protein